MLRLLQTGNSLPFSFMVDPNAEFEPGALAQLTLNGNQPVCGVSDGTAPIGVIDDIKKNAFSSVSIDEPIIAPIPAGIIAINGNIRTITIDVKAELRNPHIVERSFSSRNVDVVLNAVNGVITFVAGTELNFDMDGDGIPDAIRTVVNYTYQIPNVPGDDSTMSSGQVAVWFQRMIGATDQFETSKRYPINAALFSSENGLFTTSPVSADHPSIAICTAPPTGIHGSLEFLFL